MYHKAPKIINRHIFFINDLETIKSHIYSQLVIVDTIAKMNAREKIEAALSPQGTPQIPAVICYEDIYIRDHWDQIISHPWWYSQSPILEHQLAWRRQAIASIDQDWFEITSCPPVSQREAQMVETREGEPYVTDLSTGHSRKLIRPPVSGWKIESQGNSIQPQIALRSYQEIDQILPPTPNFNNQQFLNEGRGDLAAKLLEEHGGAYFSIYWVPAPIWSCYQIWGFEELMTTIKLNPDCVLYAGKRFLDYRINEIQKSAALGAAGIWLEDCMLDMIHPDRYQELNLPLIQAMVEEIRALNMHSIYYFCGNPKGRLELIMATGADAISLEESKKSFSIDIQEVAQTVAGRHALLGNLDAIHTLPAAREAELRAALKYQVEAAWINKGRFIMSIGSPITPETTPQQVRLFTSLTREIGNR